MRRALVAWAAATDALPILSSITSALSRDNGTGLMHLYMWLFWAWIVTVLPRLAFYAFNFVNLRRTGYVAACASVLFVIWGTTRGRTSIRVNRVEICSDRIPEAFDGFRFVQITDTHVGTLVRPERELTRLADSVNALRPEAVFFTGDLVNIRAGGAGRTHHGAPAADRRSGLVGHGQPRRGNLRQGFAAFPGGRGRPARWSRASGRWGGPSWRTRPSTCGAALTASRSRGCRSTPRCANAATTATCRARPFPGLTPGFRIRSTTSPSYTSRSSGEQIVEAGYGDLTLAGHVHSMQLKIRPWGRGWSPAKWIYKHWSGRYDTGRHTLYVNDGTGYVAYPMRLGAWPEVTLFTLKRCR